MRYRIRVVFASTQALDMHLFRLSQLSAVFALGNGATLLLDLVERPVGVVTCRGAMSLDAWLTET